MLGRTTAQNPSRRAIRPPPEDPENVSKSQKRLNETISSIYDHAKKNEWDEIWELLIDNPTIHPDERPEGEELSLIHIAAQRGDFELYEKLIRSYGADPLALTEVRKPPLMRRGKPQEDPDVEDRGLTPYEIAEESGGIQFLNQVQQFGRGKFCDKTPIQFDTEKFPQLVTSNRWIGTLMQWELQEDDPELVHKGLVSIFPGQKLTVKTRGGQRVNVAEKFKDVTLEDLPAMLCAAYAVDGPLAEIVERELERQGRGDMERGDDEKREGMLSFARCLHSVCMAPKHEKLRRHPTFCYRVCRLDEELLKRYVPVKNMPTAELIMFPGFLTATKSGEAVWRQLDLYNGNCVFIISPSYGQFPVDISRVSDAPEDEELIYPVGQAFRIMANTEVARVDLEGYIEAEMPERGDPEEIVTVIEVEAADPFYTVCRDLKRPQPVLEERLRFERGCPIRKHLLGEAMCLCELAHICREEGRVADAEFYLIKARAIRQEAAGEQSEEVAACSASIGACCVEQGKLREAQAAYEHAVGIMTQLGHDAQARFYQEEEQFEGKEPAEIEAIKKEFEAESKKRNIALAACLNHLGNLALRHDDPARARGYHEKALEMRQKELGVRHEDTAASLLNVGHALRALGEHAEAAEAYTNALAAKKEARQEKSLASAYLQFYLGLSMMDKAKYAREFEEAVEVLKVALKMQLEKLSEGHPDLAATHEAIGKCHNALARLRKNPVQKKRDGQKAVDSLETAALMLSAKPCRPEMLRRPVPAQRGAPPGEPVKLAQSEPDLLALGESYEHLGADGAAEVALFRSWQQAKGTGSFSGPRGASWGIRDEIPGFLERFKNRQIQRVSKRSKSAAR